MARHALNRPIETYRSTPSRRGVLRQRLLACLLAVPAVAGFSPRVMADDCCPPMIVVDPCAPTMGQMLQGNVPATADAPLSDMLQQPVGPESSMAPTPTPDAAPQLNDLTDPGDSLAQPVTDQQSQNFNLGNSLARGGGAGAGSLALADTPNMMGDFLGGGRNSLFNYNLAGDANPSFASGGSNVTNSKLSDNNSAIPRDRVSMRYHYFNDAASQLALRQQGSLFISLFNPNGAGNFQQLVGEGFAQEFDTHLLELGMERRVTENYSIEVRVPTVVTLDSNLSLSATDVISPFGDDVLYGQSNFGGTMGNYDFEFRDISIINKFALIRTCDRVVSGGFGLRLPTGRDGSISVLDGVNTDPSVSANIDRNGNGMFDGAPPDITLPFATAFRNRDVSTDFRTVSITPFLASTGRLGKKSFYNAFTSLDLPIGENKVTYRETYLDTVLGPGFVGGQEFDGNGNPQYSVLSNPEQVQSIREQTLLNFDISVGRWLYESRCRNARLRRVAVLGELHYTTTLNDADIAQFQSLEPGAMGPTQTAQLNPSGSSIVTAANASPVDESPFQVGNIANRIDALNANIGLVSQWGDSWTVSTGLGVPLRERDDALFDYEFQLQINYYPGGFGGLPTMF